MEKGHASKSPKPSTIKRMPCRVCHEPIYEKAVKCIHCNSYQDWSSHFLRWSTFLVSLVAVLPLWGIAVSLYEIAFPGKTANIEAALTGCDLEEIRVAYENSGKVSGIVTDVNFAMEREGKLHKSDFAVGPSQGALDIIVIPTEPPVTVTYKAFIGGTPTNFITESQTNKACFYVMTIKWIDLKGSKKELIRKCSCP